MKRKKHDERSDQNSSVKILHQIKYSSYSYHPSLIPSDESIKIAKKLFTIGNKFLEKELPGYKRRIIKDKHKEIMSRMSSEVDGYFVKKNNDNKTLQGRNDFFKKIQTNIKADIKSIEKNVGEILTYLGEETLGGESINPEKEAYNIAVRRNIFDSMMKIPSKVKENILNDSSLREMTVGYLKLLEDACHRLASENLKPARAKDELNPAMINFLVWLFSEWTGRSFIKTIVIDYDGPKSDLRDVGHRFVHALMLQIDPEITAEKIQAVLQKIEVN